MTGLVVERSRAMERLSALVLYVENKESLCS